MNHRHVAAAVVLVWSGVACSSNPKVVGGTGSATVSSTSGTPSPTTAAAIMPETSVAVTAVADTTVTAVPVTTATGGFVDPRLELEPLGIDGECSEAGCISVAVTLAGEVVTYDSGNSTLTFTRSGGSLVVESTLGDLAYLVLMGPEDVAYIAGVPPTASDPWLELIAVPTTGATAGQQVARVGDLDGSGDSTLIATATGVMQVACCGRGEQLPEAGAPVAMGWVTSAGESSGVKLPEVHLEYPDDDTTIVVRTDVDGAEQRWTVPSMLAGRDMPPVAATADGGALVWMYDALGDPEAPAVLYDLRPDGTADTFEMGQFRYVAAMHASRFVVSYDGETYVRIALP